MSACESVYSTTEERCTADWSHSWRSKQLLRCFSEQTKLMSKVKVPCTLCGELHHPLQLCPCPRCYQVHPGSYCCNPCAICNRLHDGSCVGCIKNRCLLCGDPHQPWGTCPCPRCLLRHACDYCPNEEEWFLHPYNASWIRLIADRCMLCGHQHSVDSVCPCAVCHQWHVGFDCPLYLPSLVVPAEYPCQRCNVWHGADVCHLSAEMPSSLQPIRVPRLLLLHRAVAAEAIANEAPVFAAPAHSDAASDYRDIGSMTVPCTHCGARFWRGEKIQCCYNGSLLIPEPDVPDSLSSIILSSAVRTHMRSYNMSMAMVSVGHQKAGFPDGVFTISGRSFHRIGTLVPATGQPPNFAQIYTVDTNVATDRRSEIFGDRLDRSVLRALHDQMLIHNRCVSEFCRVAATDVHELVWTTEDNIMGMQMGALVAVAGDKRSIVIKRQGNPRELQMINDGHPLYHTLAFPLLFPTGSPGWFCGMTRSPDDGSPPRLVSLHDYGRYMLMHRERSVTAQLI